MYGFIDKSDFETTLKTCKSTQIPPKPRRNDVSIILIEICFNFIADIKFIPFVTSKIPLNKAPEIIVGTLSLLQIGSNSIVII